MSRRRRNEPLTDIPAAIAQGKQDRADLTAVHRIERRIKDRMDVLARTGDIWRRAKILGDLADWLAGEQDVLIRAQDVRRRLRRADP